MRTKEIRFELSTYKGQGYINIQFYLPFLLFRRHFYNSNFNVWKEFNFCHYFAKYFMFVCGIDLNWIKIFKIHYIHNIRVIDISFLVFHFKIKWHSLIMKRRLKKY